MTGFVFSVKRPYAVNCGWMERSISQWKASKVLSLTVLVPSTDYTYMRCLDKHRVAGSLYRHMISNCPRKLPDLSCMKAGCRWYFGAVFGGSAHTKEPIEQVSYLCLKWLEYKVRSVFFSPGLPITFGGICLSLIKSTGGDWSPSKIEGPIRDRRSFCHFRKALQKDRLCM